MEHKTRHLIQATIAGERTAQLEFYRKYARWLFSMVIRIIPSERDAEEVVQDTVLKIFNHLHELDPETNEAAFMAWMKKICIRTAIDEVRRREPLSEAWEEHRHEIERFSPDNEEEPDYTISVKNIRMLLNELSDGYRIVLNLHLFEGYDFEEIAEILNVKGASVRSQYLRGKKKLIDLISKTGKIKIPYLVNK